MYFQDELRFGTRTELKRKWTPQAHRPKSPVKIGYEFAYLYLALCPYNGERMYSHPFAMFLPYMNKQCFSIFSQQFAQTLPAPTLLITDKASTHQPSLLTDTCISLHHLPAACPMDLVRSNQSGRKSFQGDPQKLS